MHRWFGAALVICLMAMLPGGQAVTWDDPAGDQEMSRGVADGPGAPERHWLGVGEFGWYPQADVLSATIEETDEHIIFDVTLSATESDATEEPPIPDAEFYEWSYAWSFTYDGDPLVASFDVWDPEDEYAWFAVYEVVPQNGYDRYIYRLVWLGEPKDDEPGYRVEIPKAFWRNGAGVPMREGDVLEDMTFRAGDSQRFRFGFGPCMTTDPTSGPSYGDCRWRVRDLLKDGDGLGDFTIEKTPPNVGHLFSRFDDPIRQSNGLGTTYVYDLNLHNLEPEQDTVFLQVQDIPEGWDVHHPSAIAFDGKGATTVPIAVTVPFQHVHGDSKIMRLTVLSERDAGATMDLYFGVVFADPPQPAGHHATLRLHAEEDGWWGWMNTLKDDPEGTGSTIGPWYASYGLDEFHLGWEVHLDPALDIGLDFKVSETAELRVPIEFDQDFEGDVRARLMLYDWSEDTYTRLADGTLTDFTATAGTPKEAQISLAVDPGADRVPPQRSTNLVLVINATSETLLPFGSSGANVIHTEGASLTLPLVDYHDEADLSGLMQTAFDITARNHSYAEVNPGRTAVMAFNVTNLLDERATLDWEIRGTVPYTEWASLPTPTTHLRPGGEGVVVIAYTPPASAQEGDTAEFVLMGTDREKPDRQVFTRAVFFIETEEDIPDQADEAKTLREEAEAANAKNRKQSPTLPVLALLAGLAVLAARRR